MQQVGLCILNETIYNVIVLCCFSYCFFVVIGVLIGSNVHFFPVIYRFQCVILEPGLSEVSLDQCAVQRNQEYRINALL